MRSDPPAVNAARVEMSGFSPSWTTRKTFTSVSTPSAISATMEVFDCSAESLRDEDTGMRPPSVWPVARACSPSAFPAPVISATSAAT